MELMNLDNIDSIDATHSDQVLRRDLLGEGSYGQKQDYPHEDDSDIPGPTKVTTVIGRRRQGPVRRPHRILGKMGGRICSKVFRYHWSPTSAEVSST